MKFQDHRKFILKSTCCETGYNWSFDGYFVAASQAEMQWLRDGLRHCWGNFVNVGFLHNLLVTQICAMLLNYFLNIILNKVFRILVHGVLPPFYSIFMYLSIWLFVLQRRKQPNWRFGLSLICCLFRHRGARSSHVSLQRLSKPCSSLKQRFFLFAWLVIEWF